MWILNLYYAGPAAQGAYSPPANKKIPLKKIGWINISYYLFRYRLCHIIKIYFQPFNAWCTLKGHTYLNLQLKTASFFKYVWLVSGYQALRVKLKFVPVFDFPTINVGSCVHRKSCKLISNLQSYDIVTFKHVFTSWLASNSGFA